MDIRSNSDAALPTNRRRAERPASPIPEAESGVSSTAATPPETSARQLETSARQLDSPSDSPRQVIEEAQTVIRHPPGRRHAEYAPADERGDPAGTATGSSRRSVNSAGESGRGGQDGDWRTTDRRREASSRRGNGSSGPRGSGTGNDTGLPQTPAALTRALEGQSLNHFHLLEQIGGGGMGAVFRAYDERLGRTVAVKVIPFADGDPDLKRRFRNEAQSAARLDHPLIARVFEVGNDGPWHYIVFEYVDGQNVRDRVAQDGPLTLDDAVYITSQLAEAIGHASQRGIVHRDIKPSNVIVTSEGAIKLVDMGLARSESFETSEDLTASGVTLGTFDYISPEQARDPRLADIRSDLYSLGCTFFFMLTGSPPFPGGTMLQKLLSHGNAAIPDVRETRADASGDLAAVLEKMLAKQPDDRYQNSADLVADLRELAVREELSRSRGIHPMPIPERSATWERLRRHLPWMVAASLLVISAAWLEVASWQTRSDFNASVRSTVSPQAVESIPPFRPPTDGEWKRLPPGNRANPGSGNTASPGNFSRESIASPVSPEGGTGRSEATEIDSSGAGLSPGMIDPEIPNAELPPGVASPLSGAAGRTSGDIPAPAGSDNGGNTPPPLRPTPFPAPDSADNRGDVRDTAVARRSDDGSAASPPGMTPPDGSPRTDDGTRPSASSGDSSSDSRSSGTTSSVAASSGESTSGPLSGTTAVEGIGEGGTTNAPGSVSSAGGASAAEGNDPSPLMRRPGDPPSLGGFPPPVDYEGFAGSGSGSASSPLDGTGAMPVTPSGSVVGDQRPVPSPDDLEPPLFPGLGPTEAIGSARRQSDTRAGGNAPPAAISKPRLVRIVGSDRYDNAGIRQQAASDRAVLVTSFQEALQQADMFELDLIEIATPKLISDPVVIPRSDLLVRSTVPGGSWLVFRSSDEVDMQRSEIISVGSHRIEFVDLHFSWAVPATETDGGALLSMAENRQVRLTDCTITIDNPSRREDIHAIDVTVGGAPSPESVEPSAVSVPTLPLVSIELYNVIVRGQISMIRMRNAAELQLLWENGLLAVSGRLLETGGSADRPRPTAGAIQLSMTRLTALVPAGLVRMQLTSRTPYPVRIERRAEESVFVSDRGSPHIEITGIARSDRDGTWLRLRGASNAYETDGSLSDPLLLIRDEFSQVQTVSMSDLLGEMPPEWAEERTPRWVVRWSEPLPGSAPPSRLVPADFRQDGSLVGGFQERSLPRLPM